jgi:hypothetical protein
MERVVQWLAIAAAAAIAAVGLFELNQRSEEPPPRAIQPTVLPSPTELRTRAPIALPTASVPRTAPAPKPTATLRAAAPATARATVAPPPTPTPTPPTPIPPAPTVPPPGTRPTPKTGGGALQAGLTLAALAVALRIVVRRAY